MARDSRDTGDNASSVSRSGNHNRTSAKRSSNLEGSSRSVLMAMLPKDQQNRIGNDLRYVEDDDGLWDVALAIAIAARDGHSKSITEVEKRVKTAAENAIDQHITVRAIQSWTALTGIIAAAVGIGTVIGTIIGAALVTQLIQ